MSRSSTDNLAQKIARILEAESASVDLASIQAGIDKISERLERLERDRTTPHSALATPHAKHPSQDKFEVAEAIADQIFAGMQKEKACTFEPTKPCDHCSMCSSRGF
ncbi:MAG: hypothetical protein ABI791_05100 [Acidobacteriota bacterium]